MHVAVYIRMAWHGTRRSIHVYACNDELFYCMPAFTSDRSAGCLGRHFSASNFLDKPAGDSCVWRQADTDWLARDESSRTRPFRASLSLGFFLGSRPGACLLVACSIVVVVLHPPLSVPPPLPRPAAWPACCAVL